MTTRRIEFLPLSQLKGDTRNPKDHDLGAIHQSVARFGFVEPPAIDGRTGRLIAGHGRVEALRQRRAAGEPPPDGVMAGDDGEWLVPVLVGWESGDDMTAAAYLLASNQTTVLGGWHDQQLLDLLTEIGRTDPNLFAATGFTEDDVASLDAVLAGVFDGPPPDVAPRPTIADQFLIPPFSVLDGRSGWWRSRKRAWLALGIVSEVGRDRNLAIKGQDSLNDIRGQVDGRPVKLALTTAHVIDPSFYAKKRAAERELGRAMTTAEFERDHYRPPAGAASLSTTGTSVFDPVLCELVYRWLCPPGGLVLDPFAGGSVRGVVAAALGRRYVGVELRGEQVDANVEQWATIGPQLESGDQTGDRPETVTAAPPAPVWIQGDSARLDELVGDLPPADLVFTCPPYADLEVYSDDPADLSNMNWPDFLAAYGRIFELAVARLADDRFVVVVVGEVRDKKTGAYRGLVPATIDLLRAAGCAYWGEAILVNPIGSLAVRIARQFGQSRKFGKTHQNVLVFVKGDGRRAVTALGPVDVGSAIDEILAREALPDES